MDYRDYNVIKITYDSKLDIFEVLYQNACKGYAQQIVDITKSFWTLVNGKSVTWAEFHNIMQKLAPSNMYNFCVSCEGQYIVKFCTDNIKEETNMRKIIDLITNPDPMTVTLCVNNDGAGLKYAEMKIVSGTKININCYPVSFRDFYQLCRDHREWVKYVTFIDGTIERNSPFNGACDYVDIRTNRDIFGYKRDVFKPDNKPYTGSPIEKVIFNPPATIIFWKDGAKTVVKARDDEDFDHEKGFAMAVAKKYFGTRYGWHKRHFLDGVEEEDSGPINFIDAVRKMAESLNSNKEEDKE